MPFLRNFVNKSKAFFSPALGISISDLTFGLPSFFKGLIQFGSFLNLGAGFLQP